MSCLFYLWAFVCEHAILPLVVKLWVLFVSQDLKKISQSVCAHAVCGLYLNFSSESLHPTSAVNEEIETRGSNYIRITDDCEHLWRYIQLRMCVCVCVRAGPWQTEGWKMTVFRRQSRFVQCLWPGRSKERMLNRWRRNERKILSMRENADGVNGAQKAY